MPRARALRREGGIHSPVEIPRSAKRTMVQTFLTRSISAAGIGGRPEPSGVRLPDDAPTSREGGVPLCQTVLQLLLDVVESSIFVVASDGHIVLANARGSSMLESQGEVLRPFLHTAIADSTFRTPESEPASWSAGTLRGWRRWFDSGEGDLHALVVVDQVGSRVAGVVDRAVRTWALTSRQAQVFRLVIEGRTNKEIAELIGTSCRTVEVHITAVLDKAGVDSRARLIARTWDLEVPARLSALR
jgi:DNA-binding CsgD family transcriptional regulator